jgi:hypothetical protein
MKPKVKSSNWRPVGPNRLRTNGSSKEGAAQALYRFVVRLSLRKCGEYIISFTEREAARLLRPTTGTESFSETSVIAESRVRDGLCKRSFRRRSWGRVRGRHTVVGNVSLVGLPEFPLVAVSSLMLPPESVETSTCERAKFVCSPL